MLVSSSWSAYLVCQRFPKVFISGFSSPPYEYLLIGSFTGNGERVYWPVQPDQYALLLKQKFQMKEVSISKFTVDMVNNEYSSSAQVIAGNTPQIPKGHIIRNNSFSVEIGNVGMPGTVMVYKDNPRQAMGLPVKPFQISWVACGAQSTETAALFAKMLLFAHSGENGHQFRLMAAS